MQTQFQQTPLHASFSQLHEFGATGKATTIETLFCELAPMRNGQLSYRWRNKR